ncbi:DUF3892 domain-containing protein [Haloferax mediterranei ATCC 33500]|uniref:DUF3892 domain-containing protein n=1 Tax=Haloferax mediterranei (strain ATCC 33500 / DSM 1411 / JCM 8866 / NBRC 14739 / NCIMB 2177 / R-4) TaxID=523841 RepID=A0A4P8PDS2_HALMT|nr:DUF3892 domain-containing protein [Haloferax mediterranei ATCC 33500]
MALIVNCVDVESKPQDCRDIQSIGLSDGMGQKTPAEVYDLIENKGRDVVVEHNGRRTKVRSATRGTTKYVRTKSNDTKDDNLLKQSSC